MLSVYGSRHVHAHMHTCHEVLDLYSSDPRPGEDSVHAITDSVPTSGEHTGRMHLIHCHNLAAWRTHPRV